MEYEWTTMCHMDLLGLLPEDFAVNFGPGLIEPAPSECTLPIVLVPKKDGSLPICVEYRRVISKTVPDAYPFPRIDDRLGSLCEAEIFTTLDCDAGYWLMPFAPEDLDKITLTSDFETPRYKWMPFALRIAPATFQRALDIIPSGVRWQ